MLKRWKQLTSKNLFKNPWWTYKLDTFQIPDGVEGEYHYVHTLGSSMIVPVTEQGHILLVNQYRYLCDRESLEFPCGSLKEGHSYEQTAHLELGEETGHRATTMVSVGTFNPYNGVSDEMCTVFLAMGLSRIEGTVEKDATEEFELVALSKEDLAAQIRSNTIWDGMTLAAWTLALPHL